MKQGKALMSPGASVSVPFQKNITAVFLSIILTFGAIATAGAAIGDITTVAGGGFGYGDGGPATSATIKGINPIYFDTMGNLFIVDSFRVRKVDVSGIITTVAGGGNRTTGTDGGPATDASLNPSAVTVDSAGNLFVAENGNNRILKVDAAGIITTVAGNGAAFFSGDGGPATAANLNAPSAIAVDSAGNLFIADNGNNRIRRVDSSGIITTVAGDGTKGFDGDGGPATAASFFNITGIALDTSGNIFVVDSDKNRIRKINNSGTITTVAGDGNFGTIGADGIATSVSLSGPQSIFVDGAGNILFSESGRIRKVDTFGNITTVAGGGSGPYGASGDGMLAIDIKLSSTGGVAVDPSGNIYLSDSGLIRKVDTSGIIATVAGGGSLSANGDGGDAFQAVLDYPSMLALDRTGNLYISEPNRARIRKVDTAGIITTIAGGGKGTVSGGDGGPATAAVINSPEGITVDSAGNIYISTGNKIRKVDAAGIISTVAGNGTSGFSGDGGPATAATLQGPFGLAVDKSGNLYIADRFNNRIRKVDVSGIITTVAGGGTGLMGLGDGGPATAATLNRPVSVAVDILGNLYISGNDFSEGIRKVDTSGVITTLPIVSNGSGRGIIVSVDSSGTLFFSDLVMSRILRLSLSGILTVVAGNGTAGFSGDGGPAKAAALNGPFGIAVDTVGDLYIADASNNRIRKVTGATLISDNSPPVAITDTLTTAQDTEGTTGDVLLNDSDPDSDAIVLVSADFTSMQGGAVTRNGNNTFTYRPPSGFSGTDSFQYIIQDALGAQATGTVTISVTNASGGSSTTTSSSSGGGGGSAWLLSLLLFLQMLSFLLRRRVLQT